MRAAKTRGFSDNLEQDLYRAHLMCESIEAASAHQPDRAGLFSAYRVRKRVAALALQESHALVFVEDLEARIDAGLDRILAQHTRAKGVDGRDAREAERAPRAVERRPSLDVAFARDPIVEHLGNPAAHVGGGFLGEGDRGDSLGHKRLASRDVAGEQRDEALRQDLGLARPGAGAHQHVACRVNRVALLAREFESGHVTFRARPSCSSGRPCDTDTSRRTGADRRRSGRPARRQPSR